MNGISHENSLNSKDLWHQRIVESPAAGTVRLLCTESRHLCCFTVRIMRKALALTTQTTQTAVICPSQHFRWGNCSWGQTPDTSSTHRCLWCLRYNAQSTLHSSWASSSKESKLLPRNRDVMVTIATTTTETSHGCIVTRNTRTQETLMKRI